MLNVCRDKMLFGLGNGRCCKGLFPDISVALEQAGAVQVEAHTSRLLTLSISLQYQRPTTKLEPFTLT
jgi:hypothetical protein